MNSGERDYRVLRKGWTLLFINNAKFYNLFYFSYKFYSQYILFKSTGNIKVLLSILLYPLKAIYIDYK